MLQARSEPCAHGAAKLNSVQPIKCRITTGCRTAGLGFQEDGVCKALGMGKGRGGSHHPLLGPYHRLRLGTMPTPCDMTAADVEAANAETARVYNAGLDALGPAAPIETLFQLLGRAAPSVGLMCVGAGLDLVAARNGKAWVMLSAVLKLAVMPLIALAIAQALGVTGAAAKVLIVFHALPTAPSAYIMARQLGGDARLMAGILTAQTALAVITLPVWISILGN